MSLEIRKYHANDLEDLMNAWETASALAHPFLTEEFVAQVRHDIPALYLPNADTWVIEKSGKVFGFIALLGNEVGALFVHPDFHGTGAGKALMDKAQEMHSDLEVDVFEENTIGRRFYDRYGFEPMKATVHEPTGNRVLRLKFTRFQ